MPLRRTLPLLSLLLLPLCPLVQGSDFPTPTNNQVETIPLTPPAKTLEMMHLPPGFKATVFAHEPDVQQPIAMCWDEKGRLWVAENYTYSDAKERFDMKLKDRILIFEDSKHTGHFDKRTVFDEDLQMLTSIERGFGGVYALCPPNLLFIPTKDDKPSGPPQVVLDGFSTTAASRHTFANGLKWGPDGWLYGRIGISSTSWIDVPGTPQEKRQPTAGGIWRYHPQRKVFEPYCHGTTNPWGMDWNKEGELFFINTVIGHFWHGIQGAHFKRMHGEDPYAHIYDLIDQHADHYHWDKEGGEQWGDTKKAGPSASTSQKGGGHAHCGMMIYQGTNWPKEYRDKVFMMNLHGHRMNMDILERQGSGYVAKHGADFMTSDDPWFRCVEVQYGPDGGVYILDWCDIGECHEADGVHRTSGRIYKITYGDPVRPKETDLTKLSDEELVKLQFSDNEWLVRMARWELRERRFRGADSSSAHQLVTSLAGTAKDDAQMLNLLWTDLALGYDAPNPDPQKFSKHPYVLQNTLHLLADRLKLSGDPALEAPTRARIANLAQNETTPQHRLGLASFIIEQPEYTNLVAKFLLSHGEDATDHNLPLMYWYAIRDLPPSDLVKLAKVCRIPLDRQLIARRVAEDIDKDPAPLNALLELGSNTGVSPVGVTGVPPVASNSVAGGTPATPTGGTPVLQADILNGMSAALKGWRKAKKPAGWDDFAAKVAATKDAALLATVRDINILFGDGRALDEVRRIALDDNADVEARRAALQTLIEAKAPDLRKVCETMLNVPSLGITAIQGMATFDDSALANKIVNRYKALYPHERPAAIAALSSRPSFAKVLLKAIKDDKIERNDLTPAYARQIRSFNDTKLTKQLTDTWGEFHESSDDKKKLIASLKAKLTPESLAKADPGQGRVIFSQVCALCHRLYGEGHDIGPDLTGSGRHDVNYLIENIADPSAIVAADFKMSVITLKDGRVLNGILHGQSEHTLTVRMIGQEVTVDRGDIVKQEQLPISMMPEGLLTAFNDQQVRNLISYLMTNSQVPMPPGTPPVSAEASPKPPGSTGVATGGVK